MDTDAYNVAHVSKLFRKVRHGDREVQVSAAATDENLRQYVGEIRESLARSGRAGFHGDELMYLSQDSFLKPAFIDFPAPVRLRSQALTCQSGWSRASWSLSATARGSTPSCSRFRVLGAIVRWIVRNRRRYGNVDEGLFQDVLYEKVEQLKIGAGSSRH